MTRRYAKVILPIAQVTFVLTLLLALAGAGNPFVMYGMILASFGATLATIDHGK